MGEVVARRMREFTEIHDRQFGSMPGRCTSDVIFENHREGQNDTIVTFIDLEKSYDRVQRVYIWISGDLLRSATYQKSMLNRYRTCLEVTKQRCAVQQAKTVTSTGIVG